MCLYGAILSGIVTTSIIISIFLGILPVVSTIIITMTLIIGGVGKACRGKPRHARLAPLPARATLGFWLGDLGRGRI